MNRSILSVAGLVLVAVLFVAVNVFANNAFRTARLDLTEDKLYTLSDGSRNIIASVREPITLSFYFSETLANALPAVKSYGLRVRELLEEYATLSEGRIRLEVIDPEPFTDQEDEAVRAGLQGVPFGQDSLYFGLIGANTTDDEETIAFFSQEKEAFLEYDLTRLIYNLTDPEKPTVGLITGHQMNAHVNRLMRLGGGPEPWPIVDLIRESFELELVDATAVAIDDGIDVLLVVHPLGLSDDMLYAIDQYVLGGGRALIYVDPHSEVAAAQGRDPRRPAPPEMARSELEKLFNAWGISVDPDLVVGDYGAAQQVNAGYPGNPKIVRYLPWLQLADGNLNPTDVVTSQLGPVTMATGGAIVRHGDGAVELTPFLSSSEQSMLFNAEDVRFGPVPDRLLEQFAPGGNRLVLAARLTGTVPSAFPEGPPVEAAADPAAASTDDDAPQGEAEGKDDAPARPGGDLHLAQSTGPVNLIVVADSDTLFEQFWLRRQDLLGQQLLVPIAANADFLINALDNLAGSNDLISLRSRGKSARPFEAVETLRLAAEQKFLARERELTEKLEATQTRIAELESRAQAGGGALLSAEQQTAIADARAEVLNTRRELRGVQRDLNRDIERLETRVKFANIGLMPIVIGIVAVALALLRHQRRRRRASTQRS